MSQSPLRAALQVRRLRRSAWLLTFGVLLALGQWASHPSGLGTGLVAAMATATTMGVALVRRTPMAPRAPLVSALATLIVGFGLAATGSLATDGGVLAMALFVLLLPGFGALGVVGGGALGAGLVGLTLIRTQAVDVDPMATLGLLGAWIGGLGTGRHLTQRETEDLRAITEQAEVAWALARRAQTDELTRLPNRLHVQAWLDEAFATTRDHQSWLSLLVVDVDHFKRVNDTWGHPTGDKVLAEVAQTLQASLRDGDVVGRWGGEEFLVVLAACEPDSLLSIAERLRHEVEALTIEGPDGTVVRVTISLGGSSWHGADPGTSFDLLGSADQALYVAKQEGRNQVSLAS